MANVNKKATSGKRQPSLRRARDAKNPKPDDMVPLNLYVRRDLRDRLDRAAEKRSITTAALVREWLGEDLNDLIR